MREQLTIEEPASWRGHSFTLFVFGGIVVLCSIFFVLGMLVGRSQGQRIAEMASAESNVKKTSASEGSGQELTFFRTLEAADVKNEPTLEAAAPVAVAPREKDKETEKEKEAVSTPPEPAPGPKIFLQVAAVSQQNDAQRELANVKAKGFQSAFILSPSDQSSDRLYRIQVGPYESEGDAAAAKKELESKGFQQVFVKR